MTDQIRLSRLTSFLYALAAAIFAGTLLELLAARHVEQPTRLILFMLGGSGLVAVLKFRCGTCDTRGGRL